MSAAAYQLIHEILIPGLEFVLKNFGQDFLHEAGLQQFGGQRSGNAEEDFKEDFRILIDKLSAVVVVIKRNREAALPGRHQATQETPCDCVANMGRLTALFGHLADTPDDPVPIIADRQELLRRCRQKEQRYTAGKNRAINDPEKQLSESIYLAYQTFGHAPSTPPGKGNLDANHHGFEFCLFVQILRHLSTNRASFERAGKRGSFEGSERDALVDSAKDCGFCHTLADVLPDLGLVLVRPMELPDDPPPLDYEGIREGKVRLVWKLSKNPNSRCNAFMLERRPADRPQDQWDKPPLVDRKLREDCDDDVRHLRGQRVVYRLRTLWKNVVSEKASTLDIYVPDVPQIESAEWDGRCVRIVWIAATGSARTVIFRREGRLPKVQQGQCTDGEAVFRIATEATTFEDRERFRPANKIYYVLVAEYPKGVYSEGASAVVDIPRAPEPPHGIKVEYLFCDKNDRKGMRSEMRISIEAGRNTSDFLLLRHEVDAQGKVRSGSERPVQTKCSDLIWIDDSVEPCQLYVYRAVPLNRGIRGPAVDSPPEAAVPSVWSLEATTGETWVELGFQRHDAAEICVVRTEGDCEPVDHHDGTTVRDGAKTGLVRDSPLSTGRTYHYLLVCRYRLPNGRTAWSAPQRRTLTPRLKPVPAALAVIVKNGKVECRASPPRVGRLMILRMAACSAFRRGDTLPVQQLPGLGRPQEVTNACALDDRPDPHEPYYMAFTVVDEEGYAMVGDIRRCAVVPEVSCLRAIPVHDGIRLQWEWPAGCDEVLLLLEKGNWPEEPSFRKEPEGITWTYRGPVFKRLDRQTYVESGNSCLIEAVDPLAADWHVCVRTVVGEAIAPGESDGCRSRIPRTRRTRLSYTVRREAKDLLLEWRVEPKCEGFRFVVVADEQGVPHTPEVGRLLFSPGTSEPWPVPDGNGTRRLRVRSPFNGQAVYCRLFVAPDEPAREAIEVWHPPMVLSPLQRPSRLRSLLAILFQALGWLGRLRSRQIFCPYCFSRFAWWRVLFRDPQKNERPLALWRQILAWAFGWRGALRVALDDPDLQPVCPMFCRKGREIGIIHPLDPGIFSFPSFHGALLGTILSGKSHWTFSAAYRLDSFGVNYLDKQTMERLEGMRHSVREAKARLDRTPPVSDSDEERGRFDPPLLLLANTRSRHRRKDKLVLGLNDAAGELFQDMDVNKLRRRFFRYILGAQGLVVIVDPLQMDTVRRAMGSALPEDAPDDSQRVSQHVPFDVLLKALRLRGVELPVKTPLAVVLTKADAVRKISPSVERLWQLPVFHPGKTNLSYDMGLHWEVQFAVREFLIEHDPGLLSLVETNFETFAYFCVAPMGCGAKAVSGKHRFATFAPWRAEEPILWLFSREGYIPTV